MESERTRNIHDDLEELLKETEECTNATTEAMTDFENAEGGESPDKKRRKKKKKKNKKKA